MHSMKSPNKQASCGIGKHRARQQLTRNATHVTQTEQYTTRTAHLLSLFVTLLGLFNGNNFTHVIDDNRPIRD